MLKLVDYIGNSDNDGNPVGHPTKIIYEYYDLLKEQIDIQLTIPKNYKSKLNVKDQIEFLNYYINIFECSYIGRIKNIIKKFLNIRKIFALSGNVDILWFVNIDWAIFVYLLFHKPKQKIYITQYNLFYKENMSIKNKFLYYISKRASKKIHCVISSNEKVINQYENDKVINIPDYFNNINIFNEYKSCDKKDVVLLIGTMMQSKDIEGAVEVFKKIDIDFHIVGKFSDLNRYERLRQNVKNNANIKIINKNLDYNEYYSIMSNAKYILLPYKREHYLNRTSGVLIESKLVGAIPIAPKFLLEFNCINGIGYDNILELKEKLSDKNNIKVSEYEEDLSIYNSDNVKNKLLTRISCDLL